MGMRYILLGLCICCFAQPSVQEDVKDPFDVQCAELTPPTHGHINASDSNNLYSKVTYTCDDGYKVEGPASRQCLPVPDPFRRTGIWEPQIFYSPTMCTAGPASKECLPTPHPDTAFWIPQDITNCVQVAPSQEDITITEYEEETPFDTDDVVMWEEPISSDITVYDPAEEDLPPPEWRVMMKAAADVEGPGSEEEIDERVPMSYQLSESNIEADSDEYADPELPYIHDADELCIISDDIPASYLCDHQESNEERLTSSRWFVNLSVGECEEIEFCGDLDRINTNGLFHTIEECELRCLS